MSTLVEPDINIDEELSDDDFNHCYIVCNLCAPKDKPGALIIAACGKLIRLRRKTHGEYCPPCAKIRVEILPAFLPCVFCGHIGR